MGDCKITANITKLIVKTRLDMEEDFVTGKIKRTELWDRILNKIRELPNTNITREQVNRKFLNLLTTYKRIKTRYQETGKTETSWEYFDDFDEVYGPNFSAKPQRHNRNMIQTSGSRYKTDNESMDDDYYDSQECFSTSEPLIEKTSYKEILEHLEKESMRDQKRHEEILAIEGKKLELEEKAIEAMRELKNVLEMAITNK